MLAVLTGFPDQAPHIFEALRREQGPRGWWDFVQTLAPKPVAGSELLQTPEGRPHRGGAAQAYANGVVKNISPSEAGAWQRLQSCLLAIKQSDSAEQGHKPERAPKGYLAITGSLEAFARWVQRVARFSFCPNEAIVPSLPTADKR